VINYTLAITIKSWCGNPPGFANSPLDTDDLIKMFGGSPDRKITRRNTRGRILAEPKQQRVLSTPSKV
jgi:hypothetical protein